MNHFHYKKKYLVTILLQTQVNYLCKNMNELKNKSSTCLFIIVHFGVCGIRNFWKVTTDTNIE